MDNALHPSSGERVKRLYNKVYYQTTIFFNTFCNFEIIIYRQQFNSFAILRLEREERIANSVLDFSGPAVA